MSHRRNLAGHALLCLYLALLFYGLGVHLLESLLNYPLWRDGGTRMSDADFVAQRQAFLWRIYPLMVAPLAARVPVTLALAWWRPAVLPQWVPPAALAIQAVGWTSSACIQIPIQFALTDHGFSADLFDRLIVTDLWLRVLPMGTEALLGVAVFHRVARRLTELS